VQTVAGGDGREQQRLVFGALGLGVLVRRDVIQDFLRSEVQENREEERGGYGKEN